MKSILVAASAATVLTFASLALADDATEQAAQDKIETVCQNCHGPGGNSVSATFPRLNGQQEDYIAEQLKDFRSHGRDDPHARAYMWGMASQLDDTMIAAIAKYYSDQKPTAPQQGGDLAQEGAKIFRNGIAARNIPPCGACHGEHGQGNSVIPRIAGQHAEYLKSQLEAYRNLLRPSDIMHANTKDLTDSEIEAVVSYLAND